MTTADERGWKSHPSVPSVQHKMSGGHLRYRLTDPVSIFGKKVRTCRELGCYGATMGPLCTTHYAFRDCPHGSTLSECSTCNAR